MSVFYQHRINSSLFKVVENVLTYALFLRKGAIVVIETILVDWIESGPQRYEPYNSLLYDVKISRHLNVHWGQQIALFGLIQSTHGQQFAIERLVGVWSMIMQNTKSKIRFL